MLTREENDRLTRVGPGTPAGELLRRYWHPIAASSQLSERGTRPVRFLGEDLVLFRDPKGSLGLVADRCPHRRAGMIFGVPEEEGLRCAYHGWLWAADGRCLEQPYEQKEDPASTFHERVHITAYPVQELGGLIFAYLGPQPVPLLPRWDMFVSAAPKDIGSALIPCNWLQITENSMDIVHTEWLHGHFRNYVLERLNRSEGKRAPAEYDRIDYSVLDYGFAKRRVPKGSADAHDRWRVGLPHVFPNMWRSSTGYDPVLQIQVPIDDTNTLYFWYGVHLAREHAGGSDVRIPMFEVPVPQWSAVNPDWSKVENNSGQDISMWTSQGPISDRENEHLGRTDKGVMLFRQHLEENIRKVERGEDPMGVIRDPHPNEGLRLMVESDWLEQSRSLADPDQQGNVSRYRPELANAG